MRYAILCTAKVVQYLSEEINRLLLLTLLEWSLA